MDSEDEWAEENGEDLENKKDEEEDDEMEEEAQSEGFIVSDGYLSVSEYDFSQNGNVDEARCLEEIQLRSDRIKQQK